VIIDIARTPAHLVLNVIMIVAMAAVIQATVSHVLKMMIVLIGLI